MGAATDFDIFSPASLTEALNKRLPAKRFLAKMFFTPKLWSTSSVLLDTIEGGRVLAPFIRPDQAGSTVKGASVTAKPFNPYQINLHTRTNAVEAYKRAAGETVTYADGQVRPAEKVAGEIIARDQNTLVDAAYRTIERMCSEALFTGVVNIYDENGAVLDSVDEGLKATHNITLTSGSGWNEANGDPIANLRTWKRLVAKDSGKTAHHAVFGSAAWDSFIANTNVQNYLNKYHIHLGDVDPKFDEDVDGATYMGMVEGIRIYVYDEWYIDPSTKQEAAVVPENKICLLAKDLRAETHYAKVADVLAGDFVGEFFSRVYEEQDGSARYVQLRSAPLSVVEEADALVVATVNV